MSITGMMLLLLFLPLSLSIYYLSNDSAKEYVLLGISLLFYAIGSIQHIVLFLSAIFVTVLIGRTISSSENKALKKILMITGIVFNAGLLIYYKYFDLLQAAWGNLSAAENHSGEILLPLGISFYTFKAISYLADVYNGKAVLADNPVHDALYLSIFTQVQSGPLTRYSDLQRTAESRRLFSDGVFRFIIGFNKKVLLANVLANVVSEVFSAPFGSFSRSYAWLGSICFSLQLFYDFAGYSDMAIGLSEMFGYRCMENFNYPYMTESVSKFWRRWHISLGAWFRDYIYIPMGGSRSASKGRVWLNLLVVWILTGIWHGASWNYIFSFLCYFLAIAFEKAAGLPDRFRTKAGKILYRILSLLFINFQMVIFHTDDLVRGLRFVRRMIICNPNHLADLRTVFLLKDYGFFIIAAVIFCFPIVPFLEKKSSKNRTAFMICETVITVLSAAAFIWAISFVVAGQNNPFAYANF